MPKRASKKTNEKFMADLMKFSQNGALMHAYVLHALNYYSQEVKKMGPEMITKHTNGFISGEAWLRCAEEFIRKYNENYKD